MNSDSNMERTLRNIARILGFLLLVISIFLSYDGFDQKVTGGNGDYTQLAKLIGIVFAVTVCVVQFIFSSRYEQLNMTLKAVGLGFYAYSIWTNALGATHLLGMDVMTSWIVGFVMDIVPEPMIAWSLGDSLKGDVIGNIAKWVTGYQPKPAQQPQNKPAQSTQSAQPSQHKQPGQPGQYRPQQTQDKPRPQQFQRVKVSPDVYRKLPNFHNISGKNGKDGEDRE